ncbi:cytochrome c oxidase assembly factor 1 homolog isoform X2 [Gouania willdenowi]|uniref:Cytochrome c oxidase assembly factor 1 homolog n=2 Tax=Gouania willdenowi TaxID=441366 RepID=A0A8C5N8R7_GOUWI|nr:cytochrome c oxidase assembly factor 1 homolog isoform X2 [Gouania willdenowi]XP_028328951.1 cytochrome c oxidase assembly factor 1 homolog isoform X2 [Gouania willdenowi]
MRVSTDQLQKLTIFTTMLTGAGVMTMYFLMQKKFAQAEYHRLALQELEGCQNAMKVLGAPPLKVHNIHLTDRNNRIDQHVARLKIPVTGERTGGYLYTTAFRDSDTNRWNLHQAILKLREGQIIDLLKSPPGSAQTSEEGEDFSQ